eukprot:snap_masked-scaffold_64-processed-gene-0.50-mRNA-1 protein AED:1.00 eAED:1.00 QI:0/0/0/0/1/1/2/0/98
MKKKTPVKNVILRKVRCYTKEVTHLPAGIFPDLTSDGEAEVYKYQTNFSFGMKLQGLKKNANISSLYGLAIKFQEANSIFNSEEKKYALADLVDALEN